MRCLSCGENLVDTSKALCPACLQARQHGRVDNLRALEASRARVLTPFVELVKDYPAQIAFGLLAAVALLMVLGPEQWWPREAPENVRQTLTQPSDPCFGKTRCLLVYSAPWCPTCRSRTAFLGELAAVARKYPKLGVKVVVGLDEAAALRNFAQSISAPTILDEDRTVAASLGVHSVPHYFWLDEKGTILDRFGSVSYSLHPGLNEAESFLKDVFPQDFDLLRSP